MSSISETGQFTLTFDKEMNFPDSFTMASINAGDAAEHIELVMISGETYEYDQNLIDWQVLEMDN